MISFYAYNLTKNGYSKYEVYHLMLSPLDSVRYFEFDFFGKALKRLTNLGDYLDVSSPRLLSWVMLHQLDFKSALLINPDVEDLGQTRRLFQYSNMNQVMLSDEKLEELDHTDESFDVITCMSVLEHIPIDFAVEALSNMWRLLKKGGLLLLSVPCSKNGFDEYININEYGLVEEDADGFVFGQRFYDEEMINSQVINITGQPRNKAIFGEKKMNNFYENRRQKLTNQSYPFWREPLMVRKDYKYYSSLEDLPGVGVIALEFVK
jgi:SAM-dependent methyltransferase